MNTRYSVLLVALIALAGCVKNDGIVKVTEAPKVWAKEVLTQEQMITDSQNCQDRALAAHSSYANYMSSSGFTAAQIDYYDRCMASMGYKEVKK